MQYDIITNQRISNIEYMQFTTTESYSIIVSLFLISLLDKDKLYLYVLLFRCFNMIYYITTGCNILPCPITHRVFSQPVVAATYQLKSPQKKLYINIIFVYIYERINQNPLPRRFEFVL